MPKYTTGREYRLLEQGSLFIIGLLVYIMFYYIVREYNQKLSSKIIQEKLENDALLVKIMQNNYEELCCIRHDVKKQYAMMSLLLKEKKYEELNRYFEEYSWNFDRILNYTNCGNKVLDNIINIEIYKAKEQNIEIKSKIAVPPVLPYSAADMCSLITNILDNALEACASAVEPHPVVEVNINKKQDYLFLRVINPYSGNEKDGELLFMPSTKRDGENHGYGTKIISNIVKKYNGSVKYVVEERHFITDVMLSMYIDGDKIAG